jgi:hypothetical protein
MPRDLDELSWTVDTIRSGAYAPFLTAIDGHALTALYAVGMTADSQAIVYAYAGDGWHERERFGAPSVLRDICTAGQVDFWAVGAAGDSGLVLQNTGSDWTMVSHPPMAAMWTVDAASPIDVWCAGEQGEVFHHTLFQWQKYSLGDNLTIQSLAVVTPTVVYALARRTDALSPFDYPYYLCAFNGVAWSRVDSLPPPGVGLSQKFGRRLYSKLARLYALGPGLSFLNIDHWEQQIAAADLQGMFLENTNNMVAVGAGIFHFNGVRWYSYTPFTGLSAAWLDVWMDPSNVFIVGTKGERTVILHGK